MRCEQDGGELNKRSESVESFTTREEEERKEKEKKKKEKKGKPPPTESKGTERERETVIDTGCLGKRRKENSRGQLAPV